MEIEWFLCKDLPSHFSFVGNAKICLVTELGKSPTEID